MKTVKTIIFPYFILVSVVFFSCNSGKNGKDAPTPAPDSLTGKDTQLVTSQVFDINSIPVSDKDLGVFPFFSLPEGLSEQNKPVQRKYDQLFFPINGVMTPVEGRVWKSNIVSKQGASEEWSESFFEKSYDDAIKAAGGVKVFDGEISNEEYERYKKQAAYLGEDGSIGYTGQQIKVYIIHRADGSDVYVQLTGNTAGGYLNILQKEPFKQTITLLKADQIQKDLTEKGKAVLYINFDTDKAILKPDGKEAVAEITKALNADNTLKIAINGYTDNTGDEKHNLQLSKDRAAAVLQALTTAGIDKMRLSSEGFGAQNPIADNTSEAGKAQNRRVELVKK